MQLESVEVMMTALFGVFPYLENEKIIIRKMELNDVITQISICKLTI